MKWEFGLFLEFSQFEIVDHFIEFLIVTGVDFLKTMKNSFDILIIRMISWSLFK